MNRKHTFLTLLTILLIVLLTACDDAADDQQAALAPTDDTAPRARVIVSQASAFVQPSREAARAFTLIEGDEVLITQRTEPDPLGSIWYQVRYGDLFGWVVDRQVEVTGAVDILHVIQLDVTPQAYPTLDTSQLPTLTPTLADDQVRAIVTAEAAVLLRQPVEGAEVVEQLVSGEARDVVGRVEPDASGQIYYLLMRQPGFGWVLASQVMIEGDLNNVPLVEDAFTAALPTEISASRPTATPQATATAPAVATTSTPATIASAATPVSTGTLVGPIPPSATPLPVRQGDPPPFTIDLPDGWRAAHVVLYFDNDQLRGDLPVSFYQGALADGIQGSIWAIWGFPNVVSYLSPEVNLYGDGIQLLRAVVFDPLNCTLGLETKAGDPPKTYTISGYQAVGTTYSAYCADSPDVTGYFAVFRVEGVSFAFFTAIEPVQPPDNITVGMQALEQILNTIAFDLAAATEEP